MDINTSNNSRRNVDTAERKKGNKKGQAERRRLEVRTLSAIIRAAAASRQRQQKVQQKKDETANNAAHVKNFIIIILDQRVWSGRCPARPDQIVLCGFDAGDYLARGQAPTRINASVLSLSALSQVLCPCKFPRHLAAL